MVELAAPRPRGAVVTMFDGIVRLRLSMSSRVPLVDVAGELDLSNARLLRKMLTYAWLGGGPAVVLSLAGVTYIDASGLAQLARAHFSCAGSSRRLIVVPSRAASAMLTIAEMADVLWTQANLRLALRSARALN
jgi:anti-anti-sigma factor